MKKIKFTTIIGIIILILDLIYTWFIWQPITERCVSALTLGETIYNFSPLFILFIGLFFLFNSTYEVKK